MKLFLTVLLLILVLLIAIVVGAKNDQMVVVDYLYATAEIQLSVLMAAMLLLGVAFSVVVFSLIWLKLKWRLGQLQRNQTATNAKQE